jgi:hypothetical protein
MKTNDEYIEGSHCSPPTVSGQIEHVVSENYKDCYNDGICDSARDLAQLIKELELPFNHEGLDVFDTIRAMAKRM